MISEKDHGEIQTLQQGVKTPEKVGTFGQTCRFFATSCAETNSQTNPMNWIVRTTDFQARLTAAASVRIGKFPAGAPARPTEPGRQTRLAPWPA